MFLECYVNVLKTFCVNIHRTFLCGVFAWLAERSAGTLEKNFQGTFAECFGKTLEYGYTNTFKEHYAISLGYSIKSHNNDLV